MAVIRSKTKIPVEALFLLSQIYSSLENKGVSEEAFENEAIYISNRDIKAVFLKQDGTYQAHEINDTTFHELLAPAINAIVIEQDTGKSTRLLPANLYWIPKFNYSCICFNEKPEVDIKIAENGRQITAINIKE